MSLLDAAGRFAGRLRDAVGLGPTRDFSEEYRAGLRQLGAAVLGGAAALTFPSDAIAAIKDIEEYFDPKVLSELQRQNRGLLVNSRFDVTGPFRLSAKLLLHTGDRRRIVEIDSANDYLTLLALRDFGILAQRGILVGPEDRLAVIESERYKAARGPARTSALTTGGTVEVARIGDPK